MKIVLGSVQFGCDYGISNQQGQVAATELNLLLASAKQAGIELIDTAPAYGESEQVLGQHAKGFAFVSKIPPNCAISDIVLCCQNSLNALNVNKLDALMLHHGEHLLGKDGDAIYQQLLACKNQGLATKIGCSVFSAAQAHAISKKYAIDIVQIPASIFDQGILKSGLLDDLKAQNIEVHIRSLFLQGVLFFSVEELPEHLQELADKISYLSAQTQQHQQERIALALSPFVQHPQIDKLVLGCCSQQELAEILTAYRKAQIIKWPYQHMAVDNDQLTKPSLWPQ